MSIKTDTSNTVNQFPKDAQISALVSKLFDDNRGKYLTLPAICAHVASKLGDPATFTDMSQVVADFIRRNSADKWDNKPTGTFSRKTGAPNTHRVDVSTSPYQVVKGQGRGVCRRAD